MAVFFTWATDLFIRLHIAFSALLKINQFVGEV